MNNENENKIEEVKTEPVNNEQVVAPQPQKKSKTGLIIALVIGIPLLLGVLVLGVGMLVAMIIIPSAVNSSNKKMEESVVTKPDENKVVEKNDYDGIVKDTTITDIEELANILKNRFSDNMYGSDGKNQLSDFLGKGTITPSSLSKDIYSKYIFKLFIELTGDDKLNEGATLEDGTRTSKVTFSKEDYIKYGKILFGKNFKAEVVDIGRSDCVEFKYDNTKNEYQIVFPMGCGGLSSSQNFYSKIVEIDQVNNDVKVTFSIAYSKFDSNTDKTTFYSDKELTKEIETDSEGNPNFDAGERYEMNFTKNGTAYSFVNSKKSS